MIGHLLDTCICVELLRRRPSAMLWAHLRRQAIGTVGISAITLAELRYGVARSQVPEHNGLALNQFLVPLVIATFEARAAAVYGRLRADLHQLGQPIGPLDTLIAAHALSLDAVLITSNEKEFRRVPGLVVHNWLKE